MMLRIEADDRRRLQQVEGLALGHVAGLRDVQEDDVAQLGGGAPMGGGGADVAGADDRDFRPSHVSNLGWVNYWKGGEEGWEVNFLIFF